jgi:DNA polymerase-3 subunit delta'
MSNSFDDILGQSAAIGDLRRAYLADRLPHGMVFAGATGVGKGTTAAALAKLFLCEKPNGHAPCDRCDSCRVFDAGNHPDYHIIYRQLARIDREKIKAMELTIDVIRRYLVGPANLKSSMGRGKFFVVEEAELMNPAAQNSMLKTLEEPSGRTVIVLLTDQPAALLPTIRSRCQMIRFAPLERSMVIRELKKRGIDATTADIAADLAEGSLGIALKWIEDGVISPATDLRRQLDNVIAGRGASDLPAWFRSAADAYAVKQLDRDELASKDQATREGLALYLRIAANHFRRKLADAADPAALDHACAAIDAIARAEGYLDANVNVPIIFQQLAIGLTPQHATVPA